MDTTPEEQRAHHGQGHGRGAEQPVTTKQPSPQHRTPSDRHHHLEDRQAWFADVQSKRQGHKNSAGQRG